MFPNLSYIDTEVSPVCTGAVSGYCEDDGENRSRPQRRRPLRRLGWVMAVTRHSIRRGSEQLWALDAAGFRVSSVTFPPGLLLRSHYHERACFSVVVHGGIEKRFRRQTYESLPASVVTMPPQERHRDLFANEGTHMLVVEPETSALADGVLAPSSHIWNEVIHFRDSHVMGLARRIAQELRQPDGCMPLAVSGLVLEMLALATRVHRLRGSGPRPPLWLLHARAFLHDNFKRSFMIGEVAAAAGVHPVYLAAAFRRHFGCSPSDYLREVRLDWVAEQLSLTDEPLSVLARRASFTDQSHLTRRFKQRYGVTPGRFRALKRRRGH